MNNEVSVIVFSKDRPFQLKEYLRSFKLFANGEYYITVIWTASEQKYEYAYKDLIAKNAGVSWAKESDFGGFAQTLIHVLNNVKSDYIQFGVDDVLWYRNFDLDKGCYILESTSSFGHSYRLAPNITYCQPAGKDNKMPVFLPGENGSEFKFYGRDGDGDFNYYFELCGTLYRTVSIKQLVHIILQNFGPEGIKSPNYLEANGSLIVQSPSIALWSTCQSITPVCSVITINRVQSTHLNPILNEISLDDLLEKYWAGSQFDLEKYARESYNSIHIGDFFLKPAKSGDLPNETIEQLPTV